ncbi:glycosyltransferase family 2 protein [Candidatus Woesearchaeota archaeon]|nr:MAG: glycosyltransferase family 2 protein [Candidatus Woesearchaeota archaeon]
MSELPMSKHSVFIVIPAFNEERRLPEVLQRLRRAGYDHIIVVDDASRDATAAVARRAGAHVVQHKHNKGQGAALRTGIKEALRRGADIIVTFDADGQHQVREIARLVRPLVRGEADVALGSRFLGRAPGMPLVKRITLWGSKLVERLFLGVKLTDVHNGFRAFSRDAARRIRITCNRMAHASEIVYRVHELGLSVVEVPVTIHYDRYAREKGQSVFNSFSILRDIIRLRWRERRRRSS